MLTNARNVPIFLFLLSIITSCSDNETVSADVHVKSAASNQVKETANPNAEGDNNLLADAPSIATIKTPDYEATIHSAISFLPKDDGMGLMKVKPGNRFIVLDISVRNISKNKEVDMGQILLSAIVKSARGKEYRMNAMAIAAFTLQNPDPHHQAQYNALWGKLQPGDFYRSTAIGLEVPDNEKNFILSFKADGDTFKESKRYQATFTAE